MRLLKSMTVMRVLCFIYKGYSFQTVWAQWSTQSRTFPGALLPGIQFHDTSQHSSPLLSESYEIKYIMKILYFKWMRSFRHISLKVNTWNTVRIAAGNVSKLVVGVSSSKLNLEERWWAVNHFLGWVSCVSLEASFALISKSFFFSICFLAKTAKTAQICSK